jgi:hypothetical protein
MIVASSKKRLTFYECLKAKKYTKEELSEIEKSMWLIGQTYLENS